MTVDDVMKELEAMGNEQTKKIFTRHGAREPFFGVQVGDLKKIVKKVKKDHELGMEWIEYDEERIASAGWATLANLVSIKPDEELDIKELDELLECISKTIKYVPNRVRYAMNGFVIAVGSYVKPLTERAIEIGKMNGKVEVEMGGTACKEPSAPDYIVKVQDRGTIGKKRKVARC